jgi:hypothetical protein
VCAQHFSCLITFMCAGVAVYFKNSVRAHLNKFYYQKGDSNNYFIISNHYFSVLSGLQKVCF